MIVKRRTPIHLEWPYQIFRRRVVSGRRAVADAVDVQIGLDDFKLMLTVSSKPSVYFQRQLDLGVYRKVVRQHVRYLDHRRPQA